MYGDFVLTNKGKEIETVTKTISNKQTPLLADGSESPIVKIKFKKNIYTRKELNRYTIRIYLYKDEKYKTLAAEFAVPEKSFKRGDGRQ